MPYIFHQNKHFTFVDHNSKNGVFCQFFSPHSSRFIQAAPSPVKEYAAYMDASGQLLIAAMPDAFHLNLYLQDGSHFKKRSLIANTTSNYSLSCPVLHSFGHTIYITYLSHQTDTSSYHFVHENIDSPDLNILYTLNVLPAQIKSFSLSDCAFIFFVTHDENYHLYALMITAQKTSLMHYLSSPVPITDYSICYENDQLHIAYVLELHGKYQLCYFNPQTLNTTIIMTTLSPCKPVIFYYYHFLWINLYHDHNLKILLSIDNGANFSLPVQSSLQSNIQRCQFYTCDTCKLSASEMYASVSASLKLCTVFPADIYHFHANSSLSLEMELLLEGLYLDHTRVPEPSGVPSQDTCESLKNAPPKKDLNSAKKAFMQELDGWDLPPRI